MIQMWLTRKFGHQISSAAGISITLCTGANTSEVASATRTYVRMQDICGWAQTFRAWCVMKDQKMCGFNWQKPQMIIYAKLQCSHVRHQYGIFGGKSQTSFLRNATRAGSEEGRLFSQATGRGTAREKHYKLLAFCFNVNWSSSTAYLDPNGQLSSQKHRRFQTTSKYWFLKFLLHVTVFNKISRAKPMQ